MKWLIVLVAMLGSFSAIAGNELGNGGDSYSQEFVAIGRTIVERLKVNPNSEITAELLSEAVESTSVTTKDKLDLKGAEVDAINYPVSNRIELNRSRWKEYALKEKTALVLHEYLGIAGVDDRRYEVSGKYVELEFPTPVVSSGSANQSVAEGNWTGGGENKNRISAGFGSGFTNVSGNLGRLYAYGTPNLEANVSYWFNRSFSVKAYVGRNAFGFTADPMGAVEVDLIGLGLVGQYHFLGNPRVDGGKFDPYVFLGGENTFRTEAFQTRSIVEKDTALNANGGIGFGYFIEKNFSLWAEGKVASAFFKDRYQEIYAPIGIQDSTGSFYSGNLGLQYYF